MVTSKIGWLVLWLGTKKIIVRRLAIRVCAWKVIAGQAGKFWLHFGDI